MLVKARRVLGRLVRGGGGDRRTAFGVAALLFVGLALGSGIAWASLGSLSLAGYTVLAWHIALGFALAIAVAVHLGMRAKPLRRRDVTDRRQALVAGGTLFAGGALWLAQRPASRALGLGGAGRRARTGSYPVGDDFPVTSWIADDPSPLPADARLRVGRSVSVPAADLESPDTMTATLDCTGGFVTTQDWGGVRLDRLLERAGLLDGGSHVRVVSVTGYRWTFPIAGAARLLLATHVGGEPLSHGHGAPVRLVAPGHRGWHWVKWVTHVEVIDGPDPGAYLSTVTSSL